MRLPLSAYWRLLRRYLIPQRWAVLCMAVLLLATTAADIAGPQVFRVFVDTALARDAATASTKTSALTWIGIALLAIQLGGAATNVLARYWSVRVAWAATNGLRAELAAHLLRLDLDFFQTHPPGELIERIDGDVGDLGGFFSTFTIDVLGALLLLAGILTAVWLEDARLAWILAACSVLAIAVLAWVRRYGLPHLQAERACQARFWGYVGEVLGAVEDLRASGAQDYVRRRTMEHLRGWLPAAVRTHVWSSSMWWVCTGVGVVAFTLTRALGAQLVLGGRMTLGTILMLFGYLQILLWGPLAALSNQLQTLQTAEVSITRVRELLQVTSRLQEGKALVPGGAPAVEFRNVRFAYPVRHKVPAFAAVPLAGAWQTPDTGGGAQGPSRPENSSTERQYALEDVSFHLQAGRTLGVLGRTGSGKTTLGRLIYRFYDPQQGWVCLDGVDLRETRLDALRARIGLVTQDVQLFSGTLRDNLCFYETQEAVPDALVLQALGTLGLEHWLARFPSGLDTLLSDTTLSAGEAQLVALARVYLKNPGLIILDEASSRLDPATEALLSRALDRLLHGRTALIIAHRLSTLTRVDQVLILEQGRVVEYGERAVLAADPCSRLSVLLRAGLEEVLP